MNIHFKISRFPLTLKLMSPNIPFKFVVVQQYENNRHLEAEIKLYIALINLRSFGTFFTVVASIVLRQ